MSYKGARVIQEYLTSVKVYSKSYQRNIQGQVLNRLDDMLNIQARRMTFDVNMN